MSARAERIADQSAVGPVLANAWSAVRSQTQAWRPVELVEASVGVLAVAALGAVLPGQWGLLHVEPHPFWIVVLAMAARHGGPSGLLAGALAALAYLVFSGTQPDAPAVTPSIVLVRALMFVVVGTLVGDAVTYRKRLIVEAARREAALAAQLEQSQARSAAAMVANDELARRIAVQPAILHRLCDAAERLRGGTSRSLLTEIVELTTGLIECEACAVYRFMDSSLQLAAGYPARLADRPDTLDPSVGLIAQALQTDGVVTRHEQEAPLGPGLADQAVLAGPLRDATGRLTGVLVVERLSFLKFTPESARLVGFVLDWAAVSAQTVEQSTDRPSGDVLAEQFEAARRGKYPLALAVLRLGSDAAVARRFEILARNALPAWAMVDRSTATDDLLVILPHGTPGQARQIVERIGATLRVHAPAVSPGFDPTQVSYGVAALGATHQVPADLIDAALAGLGTPALQSSGAKGQQVPGNSGGAGDTGADSNASDHHV